MATPKFSNVQESFHAELKRRINAYFDERGKKPTGNWELFTKATILMVSFIGLYIHLVFFTPPVVWALLECVLMSLVIAGIGFNVMHDGGHGSFSENKTLNKVAAMTLNMLGGNSFMWNNKHNIIHHAYTNVDGYDDDINIQPFMRMSETQPKYKIHKYQHLYFWILYSLLYLLGIFVLDYSKYFKRQIGLVPLKKMSLRDHVTFWISKVVNMALFVIIPIMMLGFTQWIVGFLLITFLTGFVISIVFQLAHTVEHTAFPVPDKITGRLEDEWAIHQIKTTANFATHNKFVCWFVGGLNFQIEHHLFPKISHIHYPAISKIIRKACQDYGINYIEYPRVRYAVASHVNFLKEMGRK